MSKVSIYVSLKPGTTQLHLEDSEGHSGDAPSFFTNVNRGDVVVWELAKDSGIDEITDIKAKDGYFNILKDGAPSKRASGDWMGLVRDDAAGEDAYDIGYRLGTSKFVEDPDLRVKTPDEEGS